MSPNDKQGNDHKKGVSVEEMQSFCKNFGLEITLCIVFILSAIFSLIFDVHVWSIILAGIGGVVGVLVPKPIHRLWSSIMEYASTSNNKIGPLVTSVAAIVLSIVLAPLFFLAIGLGSGSAFIMHKKGCEAS